MAGDTTEVCGNATWTFTAGDVKVEVTATIVNGQVVFDFKLVEGTADLNGAFFDWMGDGGKVKNVEGEKANNMNGSDSDGNKIKGFDEAVKLGSVGGNDEDYTEGAIKFDLAKMKINLGLDPDAKDEDVLKALAENTIIGIRATSVGDDREDSLKMTAKGEYCPPDDKEDDFFPEWKQDVSNIILVFDQTEGDKKPTPDGDGYYTVKIDEWDGSRDIDDEIDDILAWLIANDPNITEDSVLLGVIIKGGVQDTNFYAYGDNDANGTLPDDAPDGLALSWTGSSNPAPANAVDNSYDYDDVFAAA